MKTGLLPSLLAAGLLLAAPAVAQQGFRVGPTLGGTLATVAYEELPTRTDSPLRGGFVAGVTGQYQAAGHWGAQTTLLFVQQGYSWRFESPTIDYQQTDRVRLNYLRAPVLATFSPRPGGRGVQFSAGPYVGVLLGGNHTFDATRGGVTTSQRGQVIAADSHYETPYLTIEPFYYKPEYTVYARRFDTGLQGSVSYRLDKLLLQVGYTLGLRNLASSTVYGTGSTSFSTAGAPYRTRSLEASLTYLFGPKG